MTAHLLAATLDATFKAMAEPDDDRPAGDSRCERCGHVFYIGDTECHDADPTHRGRMLSEFQEPPDWRHECPGCGAALTESEIEEN